MRRSGDELRDKLLRKSCNLPISDLSQEPISPCHISISRGMCRFCGQLLRQTFVDLGISPLANRYLRPDELNKMEPCYPLRTYVCEACFLVQLEEFESPAKIFSDYSYFSSYSDTWLQHAKAYVQSVVVRFGLNEQSQVIEIGSNDGYLLQYFVEKGIPVMGIEPSSNVAEVAVKKGIPTLVKFFGEATCRELVAEGRKADLLVGNNVLAHVPNLNDFVAGLKVTLRQEGVISIEFPHIMQLMMHNQFDTIYHEHFSYFSFLTVEEIFFAQGLRIFDVEELPTHGGSLRIYATHAGNCRHIASQRVVALRRREESFGLRCIERYLAFDETVKETKRKALAFLIEVKQKKKSIAGYGAPAKGNTFLNYCGIRSDFLDYTVDRSPHKQGKYLPGTHIPIYRPDRIKETKPDYLMILAWNLADEIMEQMQFIREWGGRFVVCIPEVRIYS